MLRRILVPLDGSTLAERALTAATGIARRSGSDVRLLCVVESASVVVTSDSVIADRARAELYLQAMSAHAPVGVGDVSTSVREGWVADEIEAEADAFDADLIVMSTHGRGGLSRIWLGSVADRCIRSCGRPVLLVRADTDPALLELPVTRVVVPLDGTLLAEAALPLATTIARSFGAPALLLRAAPYIGTIGAPDDPASEDLAARSFEERSREATTYLEGQTLRLQGEGIEATASVLADPGIAEAIAERAPGDLVVMSTHATGGWDRAAFGSVADKVVRTATCPVLVVPPARPRPSAAPRPGGAE